jgi:very-short-patch-repair endonuclease
MSESGIDWLKVVRLHKQIIATAQKDAYELAIPERGPRWTSLDGFEPGELGGPWEIQKSAVRNPECVKAIIDKNNGQCCLGGPGFVRFRKGSAGIAWDKFWSPLIYREVRVAVDGNSIIATPLAAYWYLSPLVLARFSVKEISIELHESELVTQVLEAASGATGPVSERVVAAFLDRVPEFRDDLMREWRDGKMQRPSAWFLFQLPQQVSGYDQNLMRDYEQLESALETDPEQLGGLALLDRSVAVPPVPEEPPIPVVPLNAEQDEAVRRIVGLQPITVVSGPPGCGKSQVVTSAIMNCWSRGKSVLFASTNNRAVEVVRERMERFEGQYPVAIRAGRKDVSNLEERLRQVDDLGGQARQSDASGPATSARVARAELERRRAELKSLLDSQKPQRVDELIRAAAQAYSDHLARTQAIAEEVDALHAELVAACKGPTDIASARSAADATGTWIDGLKQAQLESLRSRQAKDSLGIEYSALSERLRASLGILGITWDNQAARPDWSQRAILEQRLADWKRKFISATQCDLQKLWEPILWEREYDQWADAAAATDRAVEAKQVLDAIRNWRSNNAAQIQQFEQARGIEQAARGAAISAGVPQQVSTHLEAVRKWKAAWIGCQSAQWSIGDMFGVGRRSRAQRIFHAADANLRAILPTNYVGELQEVIDPAIEWATACAEVARLAAGIEPQQAQLAAAAAAACDDSSGQIPDSPKGWHTLEQRLQKVAGLASRAATAIAARENQRRQIREIAELLGLLQSIITDSPVLQAWTRLHGRDSWRLVIEMSKAPSAESVYQLRASVLAGLTEELIATVDGISAEFDSLSTVQAKLQSCKSDAVLLAQWLAQRPRGGLPVSHETTSAWPTEAWIDSVSQSVANVTRVCDRLSHIEQVDRPAALEAGVASLAWAKARLLDAANELPASEAESARAAIEEQTENAKDWDFAAIRSIVRALEPDTLRAELAVVDRRLESGSFADGQQQWWRRLATDNEAYEAVGELKRRLRRKSSKLDAGDAATFAKALRIVPVWISTAQASQAIPVAPGLFDLVMIDEASQCTLTNILPLLFRAKRIAVIGDPRQLPAITSISWMQEQAIAREVDATELLERFSHCEGQGANDMYAVAERALPRKKADVIHLREHFRSHPQIIGFANHFIYSDGLRLKRESRDIAETGIAPGIHGVSVVGAAEREGSSWVNAAEAKAVVELVTDLVAKGFGSSLGVVTPFRAQKDFLASAIAGITSDGESILVDTANGFQGDERDIIIFSPVVASGMPSSTIKFVHDPPNLVNVALTRARDALFVVADLEFCGKQKGILRNLSDYVRRVERLRKSSPAELELYSWMILEGWQPESQAQVADHRVDFLLAAPSGRRIAIEIDGKQFHAGATQRDRAIDAALVGAGLTVLRVTGKEALETPQTVIEKIRRLMAA